MEWRLGFLTKSLVRELRGSFVETQTDCINQITHIHLSAACIIKSTLREL